jgi:hypothetical protein
MQGFQNHYLIRIYVKLTYTTYSSTIKLNKINSTYLIRLATGWTVRRSNPGGGRDFSHTSRPALRPTQPPVQWVPSLSRG